MRAAALPAHMPYIYACTKTMYTHMPHIYACTNTMYTHMPELWVSKMKPFKLI
jgi:hypothetical protein